MDLPPDYVVFDESSDFSEIYRGKSMSEIFAATGFQRHRRFTFGVCILATAAALLLAAVSLGSTAKTRRFNRMLQSRNEELQGVVHELQREVSLRERGESEARAVSVRLNALVEAVPDLIYFKDSNGRHQIVNRAFEAFCRRPRKKILGRTDSELFPHRNIDGFIASDQRVLKEGKVLRTEQETDAESGASRWFDTVKAPIADADGQVTVGVSRDVTDLKAAEADRSRLADRLMHAQKMEAIDTLAGGLAQDLDNILSGVVSYPELLIAGLPPGNPLRGPWEAVDPQESGRKARRRPMGKAQRPLWVVGIFPRHATHRHPSNDGKSSGSWTTQHFGFRRS